MLDPVDGKRPLKPVSNDTAPGETKGLVVVGGVLLRGVQVWLVWVLGGTLVGCLLGHRVGEWPQGSRSGRPIKPTDKKQQYDTEVKVKTLKTAISKWRGVAAKAEQNLAISDDLFTLKGSCKPLQFAAEQVRQCFVSVADTLSPQQEDNFFTVVENIEESTLDLIGKVSLKVRDFEFEIKSRPSRHSRSSKHSSHSSRRSTTSSQHSRRSDASDKRSVVAAKVAALEAELRFSDDEATQRAEFERQRALLEHTQLRKKYEIANARLKTLTELERTLTD